MKIALSVSKKEQAEGERSPYYKAMLAAGARPEELKVIAADVASSALSQEIDGVLFCGGSDVDPAFYDEAPANDSVHVDRARDEFELDLLGRALGRRLPVLGICRGMQMINVKFGGALYQDLKTDLRVVSHVNHRQADDRTAPVHGVTITEPASHVGEVIHGSCRVNSLHHQAVKRVGHGLKVTAYSEDGLPEALEGAEYPFLVAIQWHPEEMTEHAEQRRILEMFIFECRAAAERSKRKN